MSDKSFTLIELVMVIVILGILGATALPLFSGMTNDAKIAATRGGLGTLRAAVSINYVKNSSIIGMASFPVSIEPTLFMDGRIPKNEITNSNIVNNVADTVNGTMVSENGWWYVTSGSNAGQCGAYVNGVVATDSSSW